VTQLFVWQKKIEKDISQGKAAAPPTREEALRAREEMAEEIERAKARRRKREEDKAEMERLRAEEDRLRDAELHAGWEEKDEAFHKRQAASRSLIRIREGRERPADVVAKNLVLARALEAGDEEARGEAVEGGVGEVAPTAVVDALGARDLAELDADIGDFLALEAVLAGGAGGGGAEGDPLSPAAAAAFFSALREVTRDALRRARAREAAAAGADGAAARSALQAVEDQVDAMFAHKTGADLADMERDIRELLAGTAGGGGGGGGAPTVSVGLARGAAVDHAYWEGVLANLRAAQARVFVAAAHGAQLLRRLAQVEARAAARGAAVPPPADAAAAPAAAPAAAGAGSVSPMYLDEEEAAAAAAAGAGAAAPALRSAEEDARLLLLQRISALRRAGLIRGGGGARGGAPGGGGGGGEGEGEGGGGEAGDTLEAAGAELEVALPRGAPRVLSATDAIAASDRYRARKPRYFNRVKTGYDWNKYNKAHYTKENPPPKTVQGYLFNVFYPDLLDRTRTPAYRVEPCVDSDEFVIIVFPGSAPYEPLAFKVVKCVLSPPLNSPHLHNSPITSPPPHMHTHAPPPPPPLQQGVGFQPQARVPVHIRPWRAAAAL
jgi:hypothetical protein